MLEVSTSSTLGAAAQKLGVSLAAVSKRLALLEAKTKTPLLVRTSRSIALTPEGELFLRYGRRVLKELEELNQALSSSGHKPHGLLRVTATLGFGRLHVARAVKKFVEAYPDVQVHLNLTETIPAMVGNSCDVCIRFGEPPDSRSIARLLSSNNRVICASPAYLAQRGVPTVPADLSSHDCIDIQQGNDSFGVWRFWPHNEANGDPQIVKIKGQLSTNDGAVAMRWALAGRGLVMRSMWDAKQYLDSGQLSRVLTSWRTPGASIYAVYPQAHRTSARVKVFIDFLEASLGNFRN